MMPAKALSNQPVACTPGDPAHSDSNTDRHAILRQRVLQLNGVTGITSGPILAIGAGSLAPLFGVGHFYTAVPLLQALGVGLALFALLLFWVARRPVAAALMLFFGVVDTVWVAASVGLLLSGALPFTTAGTWTVAIQADIVGILAAVELYAWWASWSEPAA
jgi:hypothetical protein